MKKIKQKIVSFVALLLCLLVSMQPLTAYASYESTQTENDGESVYLNKGEYVAYLRYSTHFYSLEDGTQVFCAEPSQNSPSSGNYMAYSYDNSLMRTVLYYGYGGPGYYEEGLGMYNMLPESLRTVKTAYVYTHILVAYVYDGCSEDSDAFRGVPDETVDELKNDISIWNTAQRNVPSGFSAYVFETGSGNQVMAYGHMKPNGYLNLTKKSANTGFTDQNSCYTLKDAVYGVYSDSSCTNKVGTLTTNANGSSNTVELTADTYYVKELTAPKGYALDDKVKEVTVSAGNTATVSFSDNPQYAPVEKILEKADKETKQLKPQGSGSLSDAYFSVKFYGGYYDSDPETLGVSAIRSWVLKTDDAGICKLESAYKVSGDDFFCDASGNPVLPLGTVTIQETKASTGYLVDETVYVCKITGDGVSEEVHTHLPATIGEQVKRGDFEIRKIDSESQDAMSDIPFVITSKTTGESHIFTTDENGYYSSSSQWNLHSQNTNGGGAEDGLWFGVTSTGESVAVQDKLGALPFDTYLIQEQRCEKNEGKQLLELTLTIKRNNYVVSLNNVENQDTQLPKIATSASDLETGGHHAMADEKVTIVDTVSYENLQTGSQVRFEATLMDQETGEAVLDLEGNPITAEKLITVTDKNGTVELELNFDGTEFVGKSVVVFEEAYEDEELIAEHKDITDENQTIYFPKIGTSAGNADTGDRLMDAAKEVTIVDRVAYENLIPGNTYKIKGVLYQKETEKPLEIQGKTVEAEAEFVPEEKSGVAEVTFTFDATELEGESLVVFEWLYFENHVIAKHTDITDEDQTISINPTPEEKTPEEPTTEEPTPQESEPETTASVPKQPAPVAERVKKITTAVKTGDTSVFGYAILLLGASGTLAGIKIKNKKKGDN